MASLSDGHSISTFNSLSVVVRQLIGNISNTRVEAPKIMY